jgi:hypothetical protein
MAIDKPARRMTLRQLLSHAEKCSRDLIEHLHSTFLLQVSDFRDLSRPVRRRSHYPTLVAMQNALKKVVSAGEEANAIAEYLHEQLAVIREHGLRERANRL